MDKVELDFEFSMNTPEAKAEAKQVEKAITGIGDTAEDVAKRVERNVGKMTSSLDQATLDHLKKLKDAKQAAYDQAAASLGSKKNNLPELAKDVLNLKKATEENNEVQDKGSSILDDLIGSMFSWQTVISTAITYIITYRKEIVAWFTEVFTGVKANNALAAAQEAVNKSLQEANTLLAKEIAETNLSIDRINDKNLSLEKRGQLLDEFILKSPSVLGALDLQNIATLQGTNILDNYIASLRKKIELQQLEKGYTESLQKAADIESGKEDTEISFVGTSLLHAKNFLTFSRIEQTEKEIKASNQRLKNVALEEQAVITKTYEDKIKATISGEAKLKIADDNSVQAREERLSVINDRLRNLQKGESAKNLKLEKDLLEKEIKERKIALGLEKPDKIKAEVKDATIDERKSLIRKLMDIDAEYTRKTFTKDAEELTALKDKFEKVRRLIVDFNKSNPKKAISLIDLDATEALAKSDLLYKQDTALLARKLTNDRRIFEEYENYKTQYGEEKARERFGNEIKSNADLLIQLKRNFGGLATTAVFRPLTGGEKERLQGWEKDIKEIEILEAKRYADAYEMALTYNQKIERINAQYNNAAKVLRKNITDEQKKNLLALRDNAIEAAKDEALKKTEIYRKLAQDTIELTRNQVKDQIKILKGILENGSITDELRSRLQSELSNLEVVLKIGVDQANLNILNANLEKLKAKLNAKDDKGNSLISKDETARILKDLAEIQAKINQIDSNGDGKVRWGDKVAKNFEYLKGSSADVANGLSKDLGSISGSFNELSSALGGVNSKAGYALDTIGKLVGVASDAAGAAASFASGDVIGGITKTIKAISGLFSISKKVKEMNAAARKEVEDYYQRAIDGEREYQDMLKERALQSIRNNKIVLTGIRDEIALRKSQFSDYAKETAEIMAKLQGQSYISDVKYTHGTWFRKAKTDNVMSSLAGKSYEELAKLLAQGKLDGQAKALVERLKELEQKGYDAAQALADLAKQTNELFTGTNVDALTESLAGMIKEGKTEFKDLADFFEQTMEDAAMNIFKNKILSDMMIKFYDEFAKNAQSGDELTISEIEALRNAFFSMTADAQKEFENLKKVTGLDFKNPVNVDIKVKVDDAEILALHEGILDIITTSDNLSEDLSKNFADYLKKDLLASLDTGDYADKVKAYHERFAELSKKGLTAADATSLKAEFEGLAKYAQGLIAEFEQRTGQKITDGQLTSEIKVEVDDSEWRQLQRDILNGITNSKDLITDMAKSFDDMVRESIFKQLETGEYADKVKAYYERFSELSKKGFTATDITSLKAEQQLLIQLAEDKIKEYENLTGQKLVAEIVVDVDDSALQSLGDRINGILRNGTMSFKEGFRTMMDDLFYEELSKSIYNDNLKALNEKLQELRKKGAWTPETEAALEAEYNKFVADIEKQMADLERITGHKVQQAAQYSVLYVDEQLEYLKSNLKSMWESGDVNGENATKNFEALMKKAIFNTLDYKLFSSKINEFYQYYSSVAYGGLPTEQRTALLREKYNQMNEEVMKELKLLSESTGIDLIGNQTNNAGSGDTIAGAIKGITAQQADLLAGQVGGQRLAQLEGNQIMRETGKTSMQQLEQMKRDAAVLAKIQENTKVTADQVELYLPYLKTIAENINSDANWRAAGGR
ncbi:MAG: hypothetical protein V4663_05965 [Bacteroidota bacterium]